MANTSCYAYDINKPPWNCPCSKGCSCALAPGIQSCCNPGDFCLSNTTCYTPTAKIGGGILTGAGGSYDPWPYNYYIQRIVTQNVPDNAVGSLLILFRVMSQWPFCNDLTYSASDTCVGLFKSCGGNLWSCGYAVRSCICGDTPGCGNFTMPGSSALSTVAEIIGDVGTPWPSSSPAMSSTTTMSTSMTPSASASASASMAPSSKNATKVGIGVGESLGVLLFFATFIALVLWRRSHKGHQQEQANANQTNAFGKAELPAQVISEQEMACSDLTKIAEVHNTSTATAVGELPSW